MKKGLFQVLCANIVFLLVGLVITFVVPKYIPKEEYAMLKTYALYISYAGFFHLGYSDGMYLRYGGIPLPEIGREDIGSNFKNYCVLLLAGSALILLVGLLLHSFLLCAFAAGVFSTNLISYFKNLSQAVGEYKLYGDTLNYEKILILIFDLMLIFCLKIQDHRVFIAAQVLAGWLMAVVITLMVNRKAHFLGKGKLSFPVVSENIRGGIVLMLGNFSSSLFTGLDRWFVKFLSTDSAFAVYSFAVTLEQVVNAFLTPVTVSMYNYFCREKDHEGIRRIKNYAMLWGFLVIACAFPLKWFVQLLLPKYTESIGLIFILFSAHEFYILIKGIYVNYYKAERMQNRYLCELVAMTAAAFLTNCAGWLLFHSIYAIAGATLLTAALWFFLCEWKNPSLRTGKKEMTALISVLAVYLVCGLCFGALTGLMLYLAAAFLIVFLLMRSTLKGAGGLVSELLAELRNKNRPEPPTGKGE